MRRLVPIVALLIAAFVLAGCGSRSSMRCQSAERYANAQSVPPVRVPEGLLPPDDSQSLVIPPPPDRTVALDEALRPCLETPPGYFETRDGDA